MKTIEVPILLYNRKMADLEIKVPDIPAKSTLRLDMIESIRQRCDDEKDFVCPDSCMVHMCSGDSFLVEISYQTMLQLWQTK